MRRLAEEPRRTERIVAETLACGEEDRKLLLLSERTDYMMAIATALAEQVPNLFLLHGRLNARQRSANLPTQCRNGCGSADCGAIGRWGMR